MSEKWESWCRGWHGQVAEEPRAYELPNEAELEERERRTARAIGRRNVAEWIACASVLGIFGWRLAQGGSWQAMAGNAVLMLAAVWIGAVLYARGRYARIPSFGQRAEEFLLRYAGQLDKQIRLLRGVPVWYVAPIAVGLGLLFGDTAWRAHEAGAGVSAWAALASSCVFSIAFLACVCWLNRRAASRLQARRDQMGDLGRN